MTRSRILAAFVCVVACFGVALACSLNPQPLPPDSPDGAMTATDGAGGGFDGNAFGDAGVPTDGAPTATDAEADVDAATDAGTDAGTDAASDASLDAEPDAAPDGAANATSD